MTVEGDYISYSKLKEIVKSNAKPEYKLVASLMWYSGLRVSEALNILKKNVDFDKNEIKLWRKGSSFRTVPVPEPLMEKIHEYISAHRFGDEGRIFPYDRTTIYKWLNKYGYTEGGIKKVHPHAVRRGFGVHYIENGGEYSVLQQIYNHRKLEMTLRYINITDPRAKQRMKEFWSKQEVVT